MSVFSISSLPGKALTTQACFHVRLRRGSLSITTPVSLLTNLFDVRIVLHRQVSLAAVSQIYVIHKTMNGYKNLKIH